MARATDLLALVDDPSRKGLTLGDPADDALIALLAHVAFADGTVDDHELAFLERVLPGRDREALRAWASEAGTLELDLDLVAEALPDPEERWACLRFATRMAGKNGVVADAESKLLSALCDALALPPDALPRVLHELKGLASGPVDAKRIADAVKGLQWKSVQHGAGAMRSELGALLAPDDDVIHRVGIDNVEVLGFTPSGVVGRFLEGNSFIPWGDIVTYTRVPTLGASLQLVTESGRRWTLVDHRLNGVGPLFDRLFDDDKRPARPVTKPKIEQVRGNEDEDPLKRR